MRAALALLGQAPVGQKGRRIAVLGDMLELGTQGAALHKELALAIKQNAIDLVFCAGPLMESLWQALPHNRRGAYAKDAAALEPEVVSAVHAGDALMVKAPLVRAWGRSSRRWRGATALPNPPSRMQGRGAPCGCGPARRRIRNSSGEPLSLSVTGFRRIV